MSVSRTLVFGLIFAVTVGLLRDEVENRNPEQVLDRLALPYRLARLYAQPADESVLMPVEGVRKTRVTNTWQAPRPGGRRHFGQDIFARRHTPVLAAADGVVVRLGGGKLGGNAVFVAGRGGRTYYYAHLQEYAPGLKTGTFVSQGDTIGFVGTTGNATNTPPHLHFAVYTMRGPIDPLPLIEPALSERLTSTAD